MALTENILEQIGKLEKGTGIKRTLFAACPNSISAIKASLRSAKRNNAPIKFAATLNQVDDDRGYTGLNQYEFVKLLKLEAEAINFTGPIIAAIDHGGPWLKDIQSVEKWDTERAMNAVKKSFENAILAGYDLIHVDPTVDIFVPKGEIIDIHLVVKRTVELILHTETFIKENNLAPISYEVGTEEVHGGLANDDTFETFLMELKKGLKEVGLENVWPIFIVGKVGTDLHTTTFDVDVSKKLAMKVAKYGSFIKGHYTDDVTNPEMYPATGIGAANVGPEFTIAEYEALIEIEQKEKQLFDDGKVAKLSDMKNTLWRLVDESNRWKKWLQPEEVGQKLDELVESRKNWIVQTSCRYIWQHSDAVVARTLLYENLNRNGIDAETIVLSRIEHDMDKYFRAFNLINLNDQLK
jgi:tagatose-1,6-bisphosphate aldolase non-catalytic subunit AgaZ/GatZ